VVTRLTSGIPIQSIHTSRVKCLAQGHTIHTPCVNIAGLPDSNMSSNSSCLAQGHTIHTPCVNIAGLPDSNMSSNSSFVVVLPAENRR
jgi:hypothetical protein